VHVLCLVQNNAGKFDVAVRLFLCNKDLWRFLVWEHKRFFLLILTENNPMRSF